MVAGIRQAALGFFSGMLISLGFSLTSVSRVYTETFVKNKKISSKETWKYLVDEKCERRLTELTGILQETLTMLSSEGSV